MNTIKSVEFSIKPAEKTEIENKQVVEALQDSANRVL